MAKAHVSPSVGGLNLRIAPGSQAETIDIAAPGEEVELFTALASGWSYVEYKGQRGYMWSAFLVVDPSRTQYPPQPPVPCATRTKWPNGLTSFIIVMAILTFALFWLVSKVLAADLPDPKLTLGAITDITADEVCSTKWGKDARHVTAVMKRE